MYIVSKETKKTKKVNEISYSEVGLKERNDLQEWIANNTELLGEELLIIQKEFDGFNNTRERLDLLALDKEGNLVIIENKLDDSGKDVVWQAMKYAGYCSTLTKENIKSIFQQYLDKYGIDEKAEDLIIEFFNKSNFDEVLLNNELSQRIILVAKSFRPEVTNTVMWALKYGIDIKCIEIIPYMIDETLVVDTNQIIPEKSTESMTIKYQEKAYEQFKDKNYKLKSEIYRNEFWHLFLPKFNKVSELFRGRSIDLDYNGYWVSTGAKISSAVYVFWVTRDHVGVALEIGSTNKEYNKEVFDFLNQYKDEINKKFGNELSWERNDDKKASRIALRLYDVSIFNKEDWNKIIDFMQDNMINLEKSLKDYIELYKHSK